MHTRLISLASIPVSYVKWYKISRKSEFFLSVLVSPPFKYYELPAYSGTEERFRACWISAGILLTIMMCLQEQNLPFLPHLFPLRRSCHHWTDHLISTSITRFVSKVQTMRQEKCGPFLEPLQKKNFFNWSSWDAMASHQIPSKSVVRLFLLLNSNISLYWDKRLPNVLAGFLIFMSNVQSKKTRS